MVVRSQCKTKILVAPTQFQISEDIISGFIIGADNVVIGRYGSMERSLAVLSEIETGLMVGFKSFDMPEK